MKRPIDVPTRETASFIASHLQSGAEILEVGCGAGQVARELLNRGYRVTGVDSDSEAVAQARGLGVRAVTASWPEFDSAPVDAVAFTRSLHHVVPLGEAVERARELLRPRGMLLLEDFAFDEANGATLGWFIDLLRSHPSAALVNPNTGELVTELLGSSDLVATWRNRRTHELHSMADMFRTIDERFIIAETQSVPYLYRYLVPVLPDAAEAADLVEDVFQEEGGAGELGKIALLGRRIAGSPRESVE